MEKAYTFMQYEVYENRVNPHITIHRCGCGHLRKHGGVHRQGQGNYCAFDTLEKAREHTKNRNAQNPKLRITECRCVLK